jgi:hypothetical protein
MTPLDEEAFLVSYAPRAAAASIILPVDEESARQQLAEALRRRGLTAEPRWILKSASRAEFVFMSPEDFDQEALVDRATGAVHIDEWFVDER